MEFLASLATTLDAQDVSSGDRPSTKPHHASASGGSERQPQNVQAKTNLPRQKPDTWSWNHPIYDLVGSDLVKYAQGVMWVKD